MAEKRLSELESCLFLNIPHGTFNAWKSKNGNEHQFTSLLTRLRAAKINNLIDSIDQAGEPCSYMANGKEYTKPGDWRAKAWIAERVVAPDRYGQQQQQQSGPNVLVIGDSAAQAILDKVFGSITDKPKSVVKISEQPNETKQLNDHNI